MKTVFVDVVMSGFLADASAAEVMLAVDVVGGAAFTNRSGSWVVDGED